MAFDYPSSVGVFTRDERLLFYELFAHNLTVVIRGIWSDEAITDAEKVDRMKWVNEVLHRVTSKIRVLRLNEHEWSEEDFWQSIQHWVGRNKAIESLVDAAVSWGYRSVMKSASRS
jgi:hypothetical protein